VTNKEQKVIAMLEVLVDFNGNDDGSVKSLREPSDPPLEVGMEVVALDPEGNQCQARVTKATSSRVTLDLLLDTFQPAPCPVPA
jgi:hypothetical protein